MLDAGARRLGRCHNALVTALLTDTYQLTMAYAYWRNGTHDRRAVFELFFRANPFQGEFTVFAGLEEALRFVSNFEFTERDVEYLKSTPVGENMEDEFFEFLLGLDASEVRVYAQKEGSVVFPRVPLLRLEGPLATVQLLETTLLCLVNYASLVGDERGEASTCGGAKRDAARIWVATGARGGWGCERESVRVPRRFRRHEQRRGGTTVWDSHQGHARALVRAIARGMGLREKPQASRRRWLGVRRLSRARVGKDEEFRGDSRRHGSRLAVERDEHERAGRFHIVRPRVSERIFGPRGHVQRSAKRFAKLLRRRVGASRARVRRGGDSARQR